MVNAAVPCQCVPATGPNPPLCCCGPQNGISVVQPACQNLPDGTVVTNPGFVAASGKSYWTYKFLTDCAGQTTRAISGIVIPACSSIPSEGLVVSERVDGCGTFTPVPFTLTVTDPNFGTAPAGFKWVKIENDNPPRYEKGVSVEYRLEIVGDFSTAIQPIKVKAGPAVMTFDCGCFLVPECQPQGNLAVNVQCTTTITDNTPTMLFSIDVSNVGNATLTNVLYQDTINIPPAFALGTITVSPPTLTVDTTTPGIVKISGNLGNLAPGDHVMVTYSIPVSNVTQPGRYIVSNAVLASATGTQATGSCNHTVDAVQVSVAKCCTVSGNTVTFNWTVSNPFPSPETAVIATDRLQIPGGLTVTFTDFGDNTAVYTGTTTPVPLLVPHAGPISVDMSCPGHALPSGGALIEKVIFQVNSSAVVGTVTITNAVQAVRPITPNKQVFMPSKTPLPVTATINVTLGIACQNPC